MGTVIRVVQDKAIMSAKAVKEMSSPHQDINRVLAYLPSRVRAELENVRTRARIEEIRLRAGRQIYLTLGTNEETKNASLSLNSVLSYEELAEILCRMCEGSMYAYSESIIKGYISLGGGVRVGVCGRASVEGERILGVYNISALNIRLPCFTANVSGAFISAVRERALQGEGVLIYSPPAGGKTTLLRALSLALSSGVLPMRIAVIDTREELGTQFGDTRHSLDVLSAYPHSEGIRIATEYMNPQAVICDEIGSESDALAILHSQNRGVPLIATAHASDIGGLMRRQGIAALHKSHVFGLYVFIKKTGGGAFEYKLSTREEVENEYFRSNIADTRRGGNGVVFLGEGAK